jgi:integrase/recombinase XerD
MRVQRQTNPEEVACVLLLDDLGEVVAEVGGFLRFLAVRGYSPNTLAAYAYDLLRFSKFLAQEGLTYGEFSPTHAIPLVTYLRCCPSQRSSVNREGSPSSWAFT